MLKSHGSPTIPWQSHGRLRDTHESAQGSGMGFSCGHYRRMGQHPQPVSAPWDSQSRLVGVPSRSHHVNTTNSSPRPTYKPVGTPLESHGVPLWPVTVYYHGMALFHGLPTGDPWETRRGIPNSWEPVCRYVPRQTHGRPVSQNYTPTRYMGAPWIAYGNPREPH